MIVGKDFEEMVEAIGPVLARWTDDLVPGSVELLPNNRYSPRYAWMFSYEKQLKYRIEDLLGRPLGAVERILFSVDGAFSEGLSNAFVHGHGRDPEKVIAITSAVGRNGLAFSLRDGGPGFPVTEHLECARRGAGKFHFAGNGLRVLLNSPVIHASFSEGGRQLNLMVLF